LAGATEAPVIKVGIASFDRLNGLPASAERNAGAVRQGPGWTGHGRGAAVVVLETEEHARGRGAEILAELAGYASTADAFHITAPSENGVGGAKAIRLALKDAGMAPDEIDYVNAHGTGTILNDLAETRALKSSLGDRAYHIPTSSTKSMTGHLMGATSGRSHPLRQAIRTGVVRTIHLASRIPSATWTTVPNKPVPTRSGPRSAMPLALAGTTPSWWCKAWVLKSVSAPTPCPRRTPPAQDVSAGSGVVPGAARLSPEELAQSRGLPFSDRAFLRRALTHRSYVNEHPEDGEDNERLEYLGDAALDFLTGAWLYDRFPEMDEGGLTRLRAALVRTEQLAAFAVQLGLGEALLLGHGEEVSGGRTRPALLCGAFEAVVGALFIDSGIGVVTDSRSRS
jgi:hypothetical protein